MKHLLASLFLCFSLLAVQAYAEEDMPPENFLRDIYNHYMTRGSKGVSLTNTKLQNYFTQDTAHLIIADRKAAKGEVPSLDGDPFVDAQDWQIQKLTISVDQRGYDKATALVRFDNLGEEKAVTLTLLKEPEMKRVKGKLRPTGIEHWRIYDIESSSGSLRKLVSPKT